MDGIGELSVNVTWQGLEQSPEVDQEIKEAAKKATRPSPERQGEKQEKQHQGNKKGEDFQGGRRGPKYEMLQTGHKKYTESGSLNLIATILGILEQLVSGKD